VGWWSIVDFKIGIVPLSVFLIRIGGAITVTAVLIALTQIG